MKQNEKSLEERIESLRLTSAAKNLLPQARRLVHMGADSLWELDTKTLSYSGRRWRLKAKKFAEEHVKPYAKQADIDPDTFDHKPLFKAAARQGFLTPLLPKPFGGAPFSLFFKNGGFAASLLAEELAAADGGLALKLCVPNLGVSPILLSGDIRSFFRFMLPMYIKATWFGGIENMSFAITEPEAGSDVEDSEGAATARTITIAKKVKGGYIINGAKIFNSNGMIADSVTVFARLEGEGLESWTLFVIEKGREGFTLGRHEKKLGQRASDASELIFNNVFVPEKNRVGPLRSGWAINKNVLNYSRLPVAAMALGHARGAFESALLYTQQKYIGNKKMIALQEVQMELAIMIQELSAIRSLLWHSHKHFATPQSVSAIAKAFCSDTAYKVANRAMELMGDDGYLHKNNAERFWRDVRLTQIYEGTNQINCLGIIEHQSKTDFKF